MEEKLIGLKCVSGEMFVLPPTISKRWKISVSNENCTLSNFPIGLIRDLAVNVRVKKPHNSPRYTGVRVLRGVAVQPIPLLLLQAGFRGSELRRVFEFRDDDHFHHKSSASS